MQGTAAFDQIDTVDESSIGSGGQAAMGRPPCSTERHAGA